MVTSIIQNSRFGRGRFGILGWGIKEVIVASKIISSKFGRCRGRTLNLGIKEVLVVRSLDFADWPFPESAAAKLKTTPKYDFAGWALL